MTIAENPAHILVIDDNKDILLMFQAMLQLKGYTVSTTDTTETLEATLQKNRPHLILMDMLLSGVDGRDICRRIKTNNSFSEIPIIMASAHPDAEVDCIKAGANYFINKPFQKEQLFKTVKLALEQNGFSV